MSLTPKVAIKTVEMHTGGEPLRIIESGYPEVVGKTLLDKRRYVRENLDHLRRFLMFEPRGHRDMFGAVLTGPDDPRADLAAIFMDNSGYSTMCGHAVIALGKYVVDEGMVKTPNEGEAQVNIQCPCGLVKCYVEHDGHKAGRVRFHSIPAFAFLLDQTVEVEGHGSVKVDISYGGGFYAFITADQLGLDVKTSKTADIVEAATLVSDAVKQCVCLTHPDSPDLAFLYGTIVTDGRDHANEDPSTHVNVFAERQVDRSPCGSGVTARVALQHAKGLIKEGETRMFESGVTGSRFTCKVVNTTMCGVFNAVTVEVSGKANYSGTAVFTVEEDDPLKAGFLLR